MTTSRSLTELLTGDLVMLNVLGQRMLIVSRRKDMADLTVKKYGIFADRPSFATWDTSGWSRLTALHNGADWKDHRRYMSKLFGTRQLMQNFYHLERQENRRFLRNLLQSPDRLAHHIH